VNGYGQPGSASQARAQRCAKTDDVRPAGGGGELATWGVKLCHFRAPHRLAMDPALSVIGPRSLAALGGGRGIPTYAGVQADTRARREDALMAAARRRSSTALTALTWR